MPTGIVCLLNMLHLVIYYGVCTLMERYTIVHVPDVCLVVSNIRTVYNSNHIICNIHLSWVKLLSCVYTTNELRYKMYTCICIVGFLGLSRLWQQTMYVCYGDVDTFISCTAIYTSYTGRITVYVCTPFLRCTRLAINKHPSKK